MSQRRRERGHDVRIFGVPGGGKTTKLAKSIAATAHERGSDAVLVVSFTRTGALEIANRGGDGKHGKLPIPDRNVGTLHAMAYRAIGRPKIAVTEIGSWNKQHQALAMGGGGRGNVTLDEPPVEQFEASEGAKMLAEADILRSQMIPVAEWPNDLRSFHTSWSEWMESEGLVDFTGMIERALNEVDVAPGDPQVGFMDEAQDATPLELALFEKWGSHMDRVIFAGDDDQAIFTFRGATPDGMLDKTVAEEDKLILSQSYRLPAAVLGAADHWVQGLSHRQPKDPLPRDAEGSVTVSDFTSRMGPEFVQAIEQRVDQGQSVMVLTACSYMLDPLKVALRERGLPYHNPYRPTRGDWNPMKVGSDKHTSAADRLLAYLVLEKRDWTGTDVRAWSKFVRAKGVFRRGAKGLIDGLPDRDLTYEEVADLFVDEAALEAAVEPSLEWYRTHLTAEGDKALQFPITVLKNRGVEALHETPKVTIGTIHSAKGAESDAVFLVPDLSQAGMRQWQGSPEDRDSVIRQWYVGMTRAREDLVICRPNGRQAIRIEELVPNA